MSKHNNVSEISPFESAKAKALRERAERAQQDLETFLATATALVAQGKATEAIAVLLGDDGDIHFIHTPSNNLLRSIGAIEFLRDRQMQMLLNTRRENLVGEEPPEG